METSGLNYQVFLSDFIIILPSFLVNMYRQVLYAKTKFIFILRFRNMNEIQSRVKDIIFSEIIYA